MSIRFLVILFFMANVSQSQTYLTRQLMRSRLLLLGFTVTDAPSYTNRYDPATKTIYAAFTWGAGSASRLALDTLKYLRPQ